MYKAHICWPTWAQPGSHGVSLRELGNLSQNGLSQNIRFGCNQNNHISLQFKQPRLVTTNTSTFCYHQNNNIWFQPKQPHFITTKPATFRPNKNNYILLQSTGKHCLQSKQHHLEPTKTATCMRAVNRQRDSRGSHVAS